MPDKICPKNSAALFLKVPSLFSRQSAFVDKIVPANKVTQLFGQGIIAQAPMQNKIANSPYSEYALFAIDLAQRAGPCIKDAFHAPKELQFKGEVDIVTETDQKVEALVMAAIKEKYPDHCFVGEEVDFLLCELIIMKRPFHLEKARKNSQKLQLGLLTVRQQLVLYLFGLAIDGTTNFVSRVPHLAISIGFAVKKEVVVGVVFNPVLDEMFVGVRGSGAYKNGVPISCSPATNLKV